MVSEEETRDPRLSRIADLADIYDGRLNELESLIERYRYV